MDFLPHSQSPRPWILLMLVLLLVAFGLLLALQFGNPQWTKWVYICQVYYWPRRDDLFTPPADHTGVWRTWYRNGQLFTQGDYENGRPVNGVKSVWDEEGRIMV